MSRDHVELGEVPKVVAMTDRYARIREALEMGATPGPWQLSIETPTIIKQDLSSIGLSRGGVLIGSACGYESSGAYPTREQAIANARLIAACDPDTISALLAERDEMAKDAARWRYIRRKLCLTGNGDGTCTMYAINLPASIPGWPEPGPAAVAEFCDSAIDAAMKRSKGGDHE